jgi:hypothetical protein
MSRRPAPTRRARAALACACVVALGVLGASTGTAVGQEETGQDGDTPPPSSTSTTSTTSPPVTVLLDDGDIGVLPPGAGDPAAPPPAPVPDGGAPTGPDGDIAIPEELPVVILPDPTPGLNAALADIDVTRATRALDAADDARRGVEATVVDVFARRAAALAARRAAGEQLRRDKALVDALAVNAVMYGDIAAIEPVIGPPGLDALRDIELSEVAADELFARLGRARRAYRAAVAAELAVTDELVRLEGFARAVRAEYLRARTELARAIRTAEEARRQLGPTILGPAVLESADLVAWYRTYYAADPPVAPITDIIDAYLRVGAEEGVRGDIAFAQAILETAGFRSGHAQGFNFAGIGAYDSCSPSCGFRFADLDAGVRAHVHLLRTYAQPGLTSAELASPPDPQVAPERVGVRGCCQRWTQLTGVWATDPNYDRKVLGIYRLMVETARALDRTQA